MGVEEWQGGEGGSQTQKVEMGEDRIVSLRREGDKWEEGWGGGGRPQRKPGTTCELGRQVGRRKDFTNMKGRQNKKVKSAFFTLNLVFDQRNPGCFCTAPKTSR